MPGKLTLIAITFILCKDIQCQESSYIAITVTFVYCSQTSYVKKVYIATTFMLCEDLQRKESLHYYHFVKWKKRPISGKSILISLCKVARQPTRWLQRQPTRWLQRQESLHCYHFCKVSTSNVRKVYADIQRQESLHYYHFV